MDDKDKIESKVYDKEIPKKELEKLKLKMKQKLKEGLITILIFNYKLGNQFFFVNPKVKFKSVAEMFNNNNPDKEWFFLHDGKLVDQEKTLAELKIKMLSKILVEELN